MVYQVKPNRREGTLVFGDGCLAVFFHAAPSSEEGYITFHFRPYDTMRWVHQIQDEEYDPYDHFIKKKYPSDICVQTSYNPDYPAWVLLCDYKGNENTPMHEQFFRLKMFLLRNRQLESENLILKRTVAYMRKEKRLNIERPDDKMQDYLVYHRQVQQKESQYFPPPQQQFGGEQGEQTY